MNATAVRKVSFNSAHRLFNPAWDMETNDEVFGLCNNPNYHGHNYDLYVKVNGPINPETGYVMDLKKLKHLTEELITNRFDHANLNLDIAEFNQEKGGLNPTAENIARVCWQLLRQHLDAKLKLSIVLYETPRNYVEFDGE